LLVNEKLKENIRMNIMDTSEFKVTMLAFVRYLICFDSHSGKPVWRRWQHQTYGPTSLWFLLTMCEATS